MNSNKRLTQIDLLRGIAALSVIIQHIWVQFMPHSEYMDYGVFGVYLFFWISGYIITFSVWNNTSTLNFTIARCFRLYPVYWLSILLYVLIYGVSNYNIILINISMFQRFIGVEDLLGVYWTLQVELMFYILIFFALKKNFIKNPMTYIYGLVASNSICLLFALGRFCLDKKFPVAPFIGLSIILTSASFFQHRYNNFLNKSQIKVFLLFNTIFFCLISLLSYNHDWGYKETPQRFIAMYVAAATLFIIVTHRNKIYKYTTIRNSFVFIGRISYPLYLFHMPINSYITPYLKTHNCNEITIAIITTISAITMSFIAHKLIEIPCIRLGKKFYAQIKNKI